MKVISIVNLKGGVGKTTSAINFSYMLAEKGYKVLLIDNDIQGNASAFFDYRKERKANLKTIVDVFNGCEIKQAIYETKYTNLSIIIGEMGIVTVNMELSNMKDISSVLKLHNQLNHIKEDFDYVIIDNAPNMTPNVINALMASNDVIIPLEIDGFSVDGLEEVLKQIKIAKYSGINKTIKLAGVLITKFNSRTKIDKEGEFGLRTGQWTKSKILPVFKNVIHSSVKVKESVMQQIPIVRYNKKSRPAIDYKNAVDEYLSK